MSNTKNLYLFCFHSYVFAKKVFFWEKATEYTYRASYLDLSMQTRVTLYFTGLHCISFPFHKRSFSRRNDFSGKKATGYTHRASRLGLSIQPKGYIRFFF